MAKKKKAYESQSTWITTDSSNIVAQVISVPKKLKKKFHIPDGLAFWLIKIGVEKLIIKLPEEKREKILKATGKFLLLLARELAEGSARGAVQGMRNNI